MSIVKSNITALILAGGKGRRLGGQDKGLVEFQGKLLIQHVLDRITPQIDQVIINSNRNQSVYNAYGHTVISDELSNFQGPLAGFAVAMQHSDRDFILTMPCDGPKLAEDYVERMLKAAKDKSTIVVAHDGQRLQPVHALIPVSLIDSLLAYLGSGERKIDRWYASNKMFTADFSDIPEMFFNVNNEQQRLQDIQDEIVTKDDSKNA